MAQPKAGPSGERAGAEARQAPRGLQRRHEAAHGGAGHRESCNEQHRAVRNVESHPERQAAGDFLQSPGDHNRRDAQDEQGDTRSGGRQDEGLEEQLPDDPRATATESVPRGEFLLTRHRARVIQNRDVRARRQQQQYEQQA